MTHCPSPGQHSITWKGPQSLQFLRRWGGGAAEKIWGSQLPQHCGSLTLWSPYSDLTAQGLKGNWGLHPWDLTVMEKGRSLQQPAHSSADQVHAHGARVVTPTRGFAPLQNQLRATL